jgi:hypothetical protein
MRTGIICGALMAWRSPLKPIRRAQTTCCLAWPDTFRPSTVNLTTARLHRSKERKTRVALQSLLESKRPGSTPGLFVGVSRAP